MKPLSLTMQAFGSYQQAHIDFTQVQNGIFLITGDTGAGKTTIFDAITFALFDETSGGKRSGEMMRSQYAPPDLITQVEFQFLYYDQTYTVIRRPRQEKYRAKCSDDGMTVYEKNKTPLGPDVELIMPDGSSYPGKKTETDKKIKEIIGLDAAQFTQIAMLAQGDFMKLLHASSKDRMEIFAKIFDTRVYQFIEQELQERAKENSSALKQKEAAIHQALQQLKPMEDSVCLPQWEEQTRFRTSAKAEEVAEFIRHVLEEAEQKQSALHQQINLEQLEYDQQQQAYSAAEQYNAIWEKYQNFLHTRQALAQQRAAMDQLQQNMTLGKSASVVKQKEIGYRERQQEVEACQKKLQTLRNTIEEMETAREKQEPLVAQKKEQLDRQQPDLDSAIARITATYPQYQSYGDAVKAQKLAQKQCDTAQQAWQTGEKSLAAKAEQRQALTQKKAELEQKQEHVEVLDSEIQRRQEQQQELGELAAAMEQLEADKTHGQQLRQEAEKAEQQRQQQEQAYQQLYQQFLDSQAAILAKSLEPGKPCPVCGSRHHEAVAHTAEPLVESSTLKTAQNRMERAREQAQNAATVLHNAIHAYRTLEKEVVKQGQKYYDTAFELSNVSKADVEAKRNRMIEEQQQLQRRKTQAEQHQLELQRCTKILAELEQDIQQSTTAQQTLQQQLQDAQLKLTGYTTTAETLQRQLQYPTEDAARRAVAALQEQLRQLKNSWETAEATLRNILHELQKQQGGLQMQQQTLSDLQDKQDAAHRLFLQTLQEQGFVTVGAYEDALMSDEALATAETTLQQYRQQVQENNAQLRAIESNIQGKEKQDTQKYRARMAALQEQMERHRKAATQLYSLIENNRSVYETIQALYQARETLLRENSILKNLDATANGRLSGKHLKFQTYIQRRYFKQIVDNANKRLYAMSNQQFLLQCRDTEALTSQGFVGLELDIYSIVNDQSRDVKTLSGGESFMAALSLALGMADMIQNTASSVHIDTMFIDEGFGSLSEDTRNQAIAMLQELSGGKRLIGIISHVTELKQQIERKLIVTKTEKGSKTTWEMP